jgi:hypothetical protein
MRIKQSLKSLRAPVVVLGLALFASQSYALPSVISGPVVNPANGHTYYLLNNSTWLNAEAEAVLLGGNLATVRSATENTWLSQTFGSYGGTSHALWIGLTDQASEGNFVWISGETATYRNWSPGEPNNGLGGEPENWAYIIPSPGDFNHIASDWNDLPNDGYGLTPYASLGGVVEVVPEPASLALSVLGGLALCFKRRGAR